MNLKNIKLDSNEIIERLRLLIHKLEKTGNPQDSLKAIGAREAELVILRLGSENLKRTLESLKAQI